MFMFQNMFHNDLISLNVPSSKNWLIQSNGYREVEES